MAFERTHEQGRQPSAGQRRAQDNEQIERQRAGPVLQRALFVHAHPDDETINNGATMAMYAAEGRGVTLVTCTAGEMGEVLTPGLVADLPAYAERLAGHGVQVE